MGLKVAGLPSLELGMSKTRGAWDDLGGPNGKDQES